MKNVLFIMVFCTFLAPSPATAKLYKWVDANGKVTYTNTAPPSSAKVVKESRETAEHPAVKAVRLEQQRIDAEEAAAQEKLRRERQRIIREEQRRIAGENAVYQKQQSRQYSTPPQKSITERRIAEESLLRDKLSIDLRQCDRKTGCIKRLKRAYNKKMSMLRHIPEDYFARQDRGKRSRRITKRSGNNGEQSRSPSIINGEWDNEGNHYTPAGGGNLWRNDGTLMQKAAGGYINTKTGQFVPAH